MARTIRAKQFKRSSINNYDATKRIFRRMERQEGRKVIASAIVETLEDSRLLKIELKKEQDSWDSFYAQEEHSQYCLSLQEERQRQKEEDAEATRKYWEEDALREVEYWSNYWSNYWMEQDYYPHPMM